MLTAGRLTRMLDGQRGSLILWTPVLYGTGIAAWDARLRTPLADAGIIDGPLNNNGGDPANRVIAPGDPARSMLLTRISTW